MTVPTHAARRLATGAFLPLRAAGWLAARRALWPLALLPVVLTALGLVAGAAPRCRSRRKRRTGASRQNTSSFTAVW